MSRTAAIVALFILPGCVFIENDWERLTWTQDPATFYAMPPPGTYGPYDLKQERFTDPVASSLGLLHRSNALPLAPDALGGRWQDDFELVRIRYKDFMLDYTAPGGGRLADGTLVEEQPMLLIRCFLHAPAPIEAVRDDFISILTNTTNISKENATASAYATFPESEAPKIEVAPKPPTTFEYICGTAVPADLRLDELAKSQDLANATESKGIYLELTRGDWIWEFVLSKAAGRAEDRYFELDSGGHGYFSRHGLTQIGEERLSRELDRAFREFGLTAAPRVDVVYEHTAYSD